MTQPYDRLDELSNNIRRHLRATTCAPEQKSGNDFAVGRLSLLEHYERISSQSNEMIRTAKKVSDREKAIKLCRSMGEFLLLKEPHHAYMKINNSYSIASTIENLFFSLGDNRCTLNDL